MSMRLMAWFHHALARQTQSEVDPFGAQGCSAYLPAAGGSTVSGDRHYLRLVRVMQTIPAFHQGRGVERLRRMLSGFQFQLLKF